MTNWKKALRDEFKIHMEEDEFGFLIEFIEETIAQSHETVDGYCCACDYDISVMHGKINENLNFHKKLAIEKIEKVKRAVSQAGGTYKYDDCYDDCINIIKKL